ncbi:MAG: hypothetical protein FJ029_03415 [Actinobacteria bacterium]|nr:hypothetical protein [Actinomycetota bacterium]
MRSSRGLKPSDRIWIDELRGIAAGAGITFSEALALQVRPGTGQMPSGCTAFGVAADASSDGVPYAGQNRDLGPGYLDRMAVVLLRPAGRLPILMHHVPGELGGTGLNGQGVCVFANSLWSKSRSWMAPPILRRAMLECENADAAVRLAQTTDGPAVGNYLLADPGSHLRNLEIMPEGLAVTARDAGVYAHANNCTDARLQTYEEKNVPLPGSESRRRTAQRLLDEAAGRIDVAALKSVLANETDGIEPVCRRDGPFPTAAGLIAEPVARTLHLSYGPPSDGRWATHGI